MQYASSDSQTAWDMATGGKPFPAEVLRQIVEKTDGVPLFVEELGKPRNFFPHVPERSS
jgi:hypothetical protein